MDLTPIQSKFILHWGEMGTKWGVNRTVAQVHALLFVNPEPLNAEQIAETLSVARSNVSTSLRELQGWGIVKVVHRLGDRRDYFQTLADVWEMYQIVMDERKRREIEPTAALLRELVAESKGRAADKYAHERLSQMLSFIDTMTTWYDQLRRLPRAAFFRMLKMGSKLSSFFGLTAAPAPAPGSGGGKATT